MKSLDFSSYEAVLFDLDSTLTHTGRYPIKASMWLLKKITPNVDEVAEEYFTHLFVNYRKGINEVAEGAKYKKPYDVVKWAIQESLNEMNLKVDPGTLEEGTKLFRWLHVENSNAFPDVDELLALLTTAKKKLGVVTNSFEKHVHIILQKTNLIDYFQCCVDPGDVNAFKPMPQPFEYAMKCLNSAPNETLFVGDEYFSDIVGATRMGIDAVWINNRDGSLQKNLEKFGEDSRPLVVVDSVTDLMKFL